MYNTAKFLVSYYWGEPADMANSMVVLLLTWNQALYRYGSFDFNKLEEAIQSGFSEIESFRSRDIVTLKNTDEPIIEKLFEIFLMH